MERGPPNPLDAVFAALAHPVRRDMLERLSRHDAGVEELAAPYGLSLPTISRHLHTLENAGLVSVRRDWRYRTRRLQPRPLGDALEWLARYRELWDDSFARLERLLAEDKESTRKRASRRRRAP